MSHSEGMHLDPIPEAGDAGLVVRLRPLDIRRAILGVFLWAGGGPLAIDEVVRRLADDDGLDLGSTQATSAGQRVSDVMRHQVRAGRARAVSRGVFTLDAEAFSTSSRYRCLHWQQVAAAEARRYRW